MSLAVRLSGSAIFAAILLFGGYQKANAQFDLNAALNPSPPARGGWEDRIIRRDRAPLPPPVTGQPSTQTDAYASRDAFGNPIAGSYQMAHRTSPPPSNNPWGQPRMSTTAQPSISTAMRNGNMGDELEIVPKGQQLGPVPMNDSLMTGASRGCQNCGQASPGMGWGGPGGACSECGECGDCAGPPGCGAPCGWWLRSFSIFAGVEGFKSPQDLGRNANFGFHEGLNLGLPLGDPWGLGFQIGAQATQSDLSGYRAGGDPAAFAVPAARNQLFFTSGLFHRKPEGGFQGGVVFDYYHDSFYADADLSQLRTEWSMVIPENFEVGYAGTFRVGYDRFNGATFKGISGRTFSFITPTDLFTLFYRKYYKGGGQGRIWAGVSGEGDAVFGGDLTAPLGPTWALENSFVFVVPKETTGAVAAEEESWSLVIRLVWYPGRPAASVRQNPFHPLFGVADNSAFLVDHH